jgi:hypothetical protein
MGLVWQDGGRSAGSIVGDEKNPIDIGELKHKKMIDGKMKTNVVFLGSWCFA